MTYQIHNVDRENMIAVYWNHDAFLYDRVQLSYGLSEWPSHSIFCVWLQVE